VDVDLHLGRNRRVRSIEDFQVNAGLDVGAAASDGDEAERNEPQSQGVAACGAACAIFHIPTVAAADRCTAHRPTEFPSWLEHRSKLYSAALAAPRYK
jgi:hypothetical protein